MLVLTTGSGPWLVVEAVGVLLAPVIVIVGAVWGYFRATRRNHESGTDRIERLELLLAGRPRDPETNMPGMVGFITKVEAFMDQQTLFREHVTREITPNGGGSIKDRLVKVEKQVDKIQRSLQVDE